MKKETELLLEQFRETQNQYFADDGKSHATVYLRDEMTRMLQLINALGQECISMKLEIDIFQESVDDVVKANLELKELAQSHQSVISKLQTHYERCI